MLLAADAAIGDFHVLDPLASGKDLFGASGIDAGQCHIMEARVVARVVPALDLAVCLGTIRRTADMTHALVGDLRGQIRADLRPAIVAEHSLRCAVEKSIRGVS
jgi:hypothetical protein